MKVSLMYPSINAKLKSMYAQKLKSEEFAELIKQQNSEMALLYLKNTKNEFKSLSEAADRIEIETLLDKNLIKDIQKIEKLLSNSSKKSLKVFLSKYEIRLIKSVFRKIYSRSILDEDLENVGIWTNVIFKELDGINNVTNFEDFLILIKKTPYYKVFEKYRNQNIRDINIFEVENKLDIMYFGSIIKHASLNRNTVLKDNIGTEIDLENILSIYRMKKYYHFSEEQIRNTIIGIFYKLSKADVNKLIKTENYDDFKSIIRKTVYKKIVEGNEENIEQMISKYIYDKNKKIFRGNLFNINFIYAYIDMINDENNDITNIIEGIRYNLGKTEILKKLVVKID